MKIIYLDQNKWIALARAVKYPAENPRARAVLEKLCRELEAGRVVLPLAATNIYETHKINVMERRFDLASTQATMSQGKVFRGRYKRLNVEIVDAVRRAYGLPNIDREENWFLSNLFFESFLERGDSRLGQPISEKLVALMRSDPFCYKSPTATRRHPQWRKSGSV